MSAIHTRSHVSPAAEYRRTSEAHTLRTAMAAVIAHEGIRSVVEVLHGLAKKARDRSTAVDDQSAESDTWIVTVELIEAFDRDLECIE